MDTSYFKNKTFYLVSGICLGISAALIVIFTLLWNGGPLKAAGVTFYGFSEEIDYGDYLPEKLSEDILKAGDAIAVSADGATIYINGEYKDIDEPACATLEKQLVVNGDSIGIGGSWTAVDEAEKKLGKVAHVYEDKVVVFLNEDAAVNVFDNYYTFEMIAMKLRKAPEEDIKNAFAELPHGVENGGNLALRFTDPNLDLGLQTEIYAEQGAAQIKVEKPLIVAGEGKNAKNHTIIRVFNEFSAKTTQFLAFSGNVTGGVKVACAEVPYGGGTRGVIAAAAYNGKFNESCAVRVFDTNGIIYMEIVPEFVKDSPYNILTGNFTGASGGAEELLVMTAFADGDGAFKYAVYSLSDGSVLLSGKTAGVSDIAGREASISLENNGAHDKVLVFVDSFFNYVTDIAGETAELSAVASVDDIFYNGLYQTAFDGKYAFTDYGDKDYQHMAFLKIFADGQINALDVGHFENTFYYNGDALESESEYVKEAGFIHMRTDLSSQAIASISGKKSIEKLNLKNYSDWKVSTGPYKTYSGSYNVWEPCFTHRWNYLPYVSILADYTDKNGVKKFCSYDNYGEAAEYFEVGSGFAVGTYADGLIEMSKMRTYPLRSELGLLFDAFYAEPKWMVALEPIHEIEINTGDESVGDYNPYMIETFRSYLLGRYGSVDNINKKFGTDFSDRADIDAPFNGAKGDRGAWDLYEGDYFTEWSLFTRTIVNRRLAEAFREALLAGFPSEIVNGHSIPEGDAIAGFLGQANTRISPIDAMMTLGAGFGATRYGYWFCEEKNFLNLAYMAGFRNTTLGEYNAMSYDDETAYGQLQYVWTHGCKYVNLMESVSKLGYRMDMKSIQTMAKDDLPRPSSAEGTSASLAVDNGDRQYQIVELGGNSGTCGLLKSVDASGEWTGDVYVSPFHSHVEVESFALSTNARSGGVSPSFSDLNTGDVIEINYTGYYAGGGKADLIIEVYEDGILRNDLTARFELTGEKKVYRYAISNQQVLGNLKIKTRFECDSYGGVHSESFTGAVMRESVARKYFGDFTATEHVGGVTFDILNRKLRYGN